MRDWLVAQWRPLAVMTGIWLAIWTVTAVATADRARQLPVAGRRPAHRGCC